MTDTDREKIMKQWDYWRDQIATGFKGSAPRDWFESVLDCHPDTERLDRLEKAFGFALISDDNGHFACVSDGFQACPVGDDPEDMQTTFWVEKDQWHDTIREAIDAAMEEK